MSCQYSKSHCRDKTVARPSNLHRDKTVARPSNLHNGIPYTGHTASLYWIWTPEGEYPYLLWAHMIITAMVTPRTNMATHTTLPTTTATHRNPWWQTGPVFCLLLGVKLTLCSANHRPGYWSNLTCDWPSTARAYSEQETENGPWRVMC